MPTWGQGDALRLCRIREKFRSMLFDHRMAPDAMYNTYPPRIDELKQIKAAGASRFNICSVDFNGGKGKSYWDNEATGMVSASGKQALYDILDKYLPMLEKKACWIWRRSMDGMNASMRNSKGWPIN